MTLWQGRLEGGPAVTGPEGRVQVTLWQGRLEGGPAETGPEGRSR